MFESNFPKIDEAMEKWREKKSKQYCEETGDRDWKKRGMTTVAE